MGSAWMRMYCTIAAREGEGKGDKVDSYRKNKAL